MGKSLSGQAAFFYIVLGNKQKIKILSWARGNKLLILLARLLKINSRLKCTKTHNTLHWDHNSKFSLFLHNGNVFVFKINDRGAKLGQNFTAHLSR